MSVRENVQKLPFHVHNSFGNATNNATATEISISDRAGPASRCHGRPGAAEAHDRLQFKLGASKEIKK